MRLRTGALVDQTWNVYIRVDDADALYAEVQRRTTGGTSRALLDAYTREYYDAAARS